MIANRLLIVFAGLASLGCESTMPYAYLGTDLRVTPAFLVEGEEVELEVTATNWGDETIYASNGCAPGLGFMITQPDERRVNPYPAAWPCAAMDSQVIEPGETDVVVFRWTPTLRGSYTVVGGLVVGDRLWSVSNEIGFEVRSGP